MRLESSWLDGIVILNESPEERRPGDVSIHRSVGDACEALEHWFVNNNESHACTASGTRLILIAEHNGPITVCRREECVDGGEIILGWLQSLAETTLDARKRAAQTRRVMLSAEEEQGVLPTTIEGLIGYIGLPWVAPRSWFMTGCTSLLAVIMVLLVIVLVRTF